MKEIRKHPAIKELLAEAKRLGVKVTWGKKRDWYLGLHDIRKNKIGVQLCDPFGTPFDIEDIVFIMAHEIRHCQHVEQKLYSEYYRKKQDGSWQIGLWAERNCDVFAAKFCKKHNLNSYLCGRKYPGWKVTLRNPPKKWRTRRLTVIWLYKTMIKEKTQPQGIYSCLLVHLSPKLFSNRSSGSVMVINTTNAS